MAQPAPKVVAQETKAPSALASVVTVLALVAIFQLALVCFIARSRRQPQRSVHPKKESKTADLPPMAEVTSLKSVGAGCPESKSWFLAHAAQDLLLARNFLAEIGRSTEAAARGKLWTGLLHQTSAFRRRADEAALLPVCQLATLVEAFVQHLVKKTADATPSALRTLTTAVEALEWLCVSGRPDQTIANPPPRFLAVDDDRVSRLALSMALKHAFGTVETAENGISAAQWAGQEQFDAIFMDIEMPRMNGFEACRRIHETAFNKRTPVVFVTSHGDFESQVKSLRSGGDDLIAKPFVKLEVTLKALTLVYRSRLHNPRQPQVEAAVPATASIFQKDEAEMESRAHSAIDPEEAIRAFFTNAVVHSAALKRIISAWDRNAEIAAQTALISEMYLHARALTCEADHAELRSASLLVTALQNLTRTLANRPQTMSLSALDGALEALLLLDEMCAQGKEALDCQRPVRILVADDDRVTRAVIKAAIKGALDQPDEAADGQSALALARQKEFSLIFMDVEMPGADGFCACAQIHETVKNANTPIVFITGHSDSTTRQKALDAGACGFIEKPFLSTEVALVALTYALRARLQNRDAEMKTARSAVYRP